MNEYFNKVAIYYISYSHTTNCIIILQVLSRCGSLKTVVYGRNMWQWVNIMCLYVQVVGL